MTSTSLSLNRLIIAGGGSTSFSGTLKNNKFKLKYHSNWMGHNEPIEYTITVVLNLCKTNNLKVFIT